MTLAALGISVRFAGLHAVEGVSLALAPGEILGLVGPNGAGKTTLVNVLSGYQPPNGGGAIRLDGADVTGRDAAWRARHGIVRTFQAVRLFRGLTVGENVEAALVAAGTSRFAARMRARAILGYLGIADRAGAGGGTLSYADERRVGIARALALAPRFLLLDEPAAGMTVAEAEALSVLIHRIRDDFGCGVLVIEHNMALIARTCERMHVLVSGRTLAEGAPDRVMADPAFRAAYLGAAA